LHPSVLLQKELQTWLETGLLAPADTVSGSAGGLRREFTVDQAERARVIKALHQKGATLAQLARCILTFDSGQAFIVYDGHEFRACQDAVAAIAVVVRAKRPCTAVDLSAIRMNTYGHLRRT
jgi:DNA-binding transcriptional MerR regulator